MAGKSSSLVIVFGGHGFDETRGGLGVVPEQTTRADEEGTAIASALVGAGADACVRLNRLPEFTLIDEAFIGMMPAEIAESVGNDASATAIARVARCDAG